jgi:hypothetical protein
MSAAKTSTTPPVWTGDEDEDLDALAEFCVDANAAEIAREERQADVETVDIKLSDLDSHQFQSVVEGRAYDTLDALRENQWDYVADRNESECASLAERLIGSSETEAAIESLAERQAREELGLPLSGEASGQDEGDAENDDDDDLESLTEDKAEAIREELKERVQRLLSENHHFFDVDHDFEGEVIGRVSLTGLDIAEVDLGGDVSLAVPSVNRDHRRDVAVDWLMLGVSPAAARWALNAQILGAVFDAACADVKRDVGREHTEALLAALESNPREIDSVEERFWAEAAENFKSRLSELDGEEAKEAARVAMGEALDEIRALSLGGSGQGLPLRAWEAFGLLSDDYMPGPMSSKEPSPTAKDLAAEAPTPLHRLSDEQIAQIDARALNPRDPLDAAFVQALSKPNGVYGGSVPRTTLLGAQTALRHALASREQAREMEFVFGGAAQDFMALTQRAGWTGGDRAAYGEGRRARSLLARGEIWADGESMGLAQGMVDPRRVDWSRDEEGPGSITDSEDGQTEAWHQARRLRYPTDVDHPRLSEKIRELLESVSKVDDPIARELFLEPLPVAQHGWGEPGFGFEAPASGEGAGERAANGAASGAAHGDKTAQKPEPSLEIARRQFAERLARENIGSYRSKALSPEALAGLEQALVAGPGAPHYPFALDLAVAARAIGLGEARSEALAGQPISALVRPGSGNGLSARRAEKENAAQGSLFSDADPFASAPRRAAAELRGDKPGAIVELFELAPQRSFARQVSPARLGRLASEAREAGALPARLAETDQLGRSPLHLAMEAGSLALVRDLLSVGADPNARDALGRTPGMLAARWPAELLEDSGQNSLGDFFRQLAAHGADFNAVDSSGLHFAHQRDWRQADAGLLSALGMSLDARDAEGRKAAERFFWSESRVAETESAALAALTETPTGPRLPEKACVLPGFETLGGRLRLPEPEPQAPARAGSRPSRRL